MLSPVPATAADLMNCRREKDLVDVDILGNLVMAEFSLYYVCFRSEQNMHCISTLIKPPHSCEAH